MQRPCVLLALAWIFTVVHGFNETESNCKTEKTFGYYYKTFYHIEEQHSSSDGVTIRFYVKARSDAHILLSSKAYPSDDDPVYEIVLGAGKNTFSDIRRKKRTKTQSTISTPDILSISEYRGFWISVTNHGIISVGESDNDVPFLFWQDPDPLYIRYFSFSTWSGGAGIWMFDCTSDNEKEEITVAEENLLPTERLRRDLLTYYDPFVRPSTSNDERTVVSLHLTSHHVMLDEKKGIFTVLGKMLMQWHDEKLQWNASEYGGVSVLRTTQYEVWLPELVLYNSAGLGTDILDEAMLQIQSDGSVKWETQAKLNAWCSLDLSSWPRDMQTCSLELGFWSQESVLKLVLLGNGTTLGEQKTHSQWDITQLEVETTWAHTPWLTSLAEDDPRFSEVPDTALSITFTLQRHSESYTPFIIIPFIVTSTMTLTSFWLSPKDSTKVIIICVDLILLSLILVTLEHMMPAHSDHTPYMVQIYSWTMLSTAVSLVTSVLVICLARYPHSKPLPEFVWKIVDLSRTHQILCLPQSDRKNGENYSQMTESSTTISDTVTSAWELQNQWYLLALLIDRVCFMAYLIFFSILLILQ